MSYNLRYDNPNDGVNTWDHRKESVLKLINYYRPEILGIQEGLHHQVAYLDEKLSNYEYIGVGRDDGKQKGEYAAIFFDKTKFAVLKSATFWLSDKSDTISVGWDASMERICSYGLFKHLSSQKKIWVLNTHFDHIGALARKKSSELIISKMAGLNHEALPTILMGDLNALPDSKPIALLKTFLDDGMDISTKPMYGPPGTFNGFNPTTKIDRRIDYIFTSKFNILSYGHIDKKRTDNNYISDHLPVIAEIVFKTLE
jgi:endonuclease/exonuclease/phosphatase family metal-dependent hydrolase